MKAIVICNTDAPWAAEMMPWWFGLRRAGHHCKVFNFPFGAQCLKWDGGNNAGTYYPGSMELFYENLLKPAAEMAREYGAQGIFMGPGTPMYVSLPNRGGTNSVISLPPIFACAHGIVRLREMGLPLPRVWGPTLVFDDRFRLPDGTEVQEGGLWCYAGNQYKFYGGARSVGGPQEFQQTYGDMPQISSGWPGLPRLYKGRLGFTEETLRQTPWIGPYRAALYADLMHVGRFGRPVFHRQALSARQYVGDETVMSATEILRGSLANERDINFHRNKPIWVGVSNRNAGMTDMMCAAAVDVARRAGFTNVRYFTRSTPNRPVLDRGYAPVSQRAFAYSQIPQQQGYPCWLYLGYALHNEVPGSGNAVNSEGTLLAVQGTDIDRLFRFLPGSLVFAGTSFPARHVMRNLRDHGSGGVSCEYEPGFRAQPQTLLYNLLHGANLCETLALTNENQGDVSFAVGDPLYAPFRHETRDLTGLYAAPGQGPYVPD